MSNVYGQPLLDDMVQHQSLPMSLVKQAAREILAVIREGLIRDGVVNVSNFGNFRLKAVAARKGFNPQTKETITIAAHQRVIFSPCKALRELIQPVHQAPIPIPSEKVTPRAAARSAPIAPQSILATKRIVPVSEKSEGATEASPTPSALETERRITPDRRHAAETSSPPKQEKEAVTERLDEPNDTIAEISLEIDEAAATQASSKTGLYFGVAALIVVAAVTASLVYNDSTEKTPAITTITPVIPTVDPTSTVTKETLTATAPSSPTVDAALEPDTATIRPTEEIDYSRLYTEMAEVQPEQEANQEMEAVVSADRDSISELPPPAPASQGTEQTEPAVTKPEIATSTKPGSFFFSEQTHTIAHGDSLWRLAREHYQDPLLWPHIFQANAAIINNPDRLLQGEDIVLPSLQGTPDNLSTTDRRNISEGYYLTYLYYKQSGHKDAFFALLEAKRYDYKVVEEHSSFLKLSKIEEIMLRHQETMPF